MNGMERLTRIQLEEAADFLAHELPFVNTVDLVVQFGSGQTSEGLLDEEWNRLPLQHMPHMPFEESLAHHRLEIVWGTLAGRKVLVLAGRYHMYEGYGRIPCVLPIWAAAHCGARNFMLTNASAAIADDLKPGDFLCLSDHINNLGVSPLAGLQHLLNSPYIDMTRTYSPELTADFMAAARKAGLPIRTGVYMANLGPHFETAAEVRMAEAAGAEVLGMSTVLEATTAHALNARVLAVSMICNHATGRRDGSHPRNAEAADASGRVLVRAIRAWLADGAESLL
jgi:purine-nucleoside phosphorylase